MVGLLLHFFPALLGAADLDFALFDELAQAAGLLLQQLVLQVNVRSALGAGVLQLLFGLQLVPLLLERVQGLLETVFQQKIAEKVVDLLDAADPCG